jgi:hypothetical protein
MVLSPDDSGVFPGLPHPLTILQGQGSMLTPSPGPQHLPPCSSEVILSDIRPIQHKAKALHSINTFLNEFLWNILTTAQSSVTDHMKAGVLEILLTSLGKVASLEAEVELKAYWECTSPILSPNIGANDAVDFPLQWSYEVPRHSSVSSSNCT